MSAPSMVTLAKNALNAARLDKKNIFTPCSPKLILQILLVNI